MIKARIYYDLSKQGMLMIMDQGEFPTQCQYAEGEVTAAEAFHFHFNIDAELKCVVTYLGKRDEQFWPPKEDWLLTWDEAFSKHKKMIDSDREPVKKWWQW